MSIEDHAARSLYEAEAIRSGWSVRQLDRQISTQFFERVATSAQPERMLENARRPAQIDPAELQHHIRIGDEWYRIDLLLCHRALRRLVVAPAGAAKVGWVRMLSVLPNSRDTVARISNT